MIVKTGYRTALRVRTYSLYISRDVRGDPDQSQVKIRICGIKSITARIYNNDSTVYNAKLRTLRRSINKDPMKKGRVRNTGMIWIFWK